MFKSYFSLFKRAVIYPAVIGNLLHFFYKQSPFAVEGSDFFVIQMFKDMLYFIDLPEQFYTFLTFYFLGYSYGIISKFLSVRKMKTKIVGSLFIWGLKFAIMLWTYYLAPIVLVIDIVMTMIMAQKKRTKQPKQRTEPQPTASEYV